MHLMRRFLFLVGLALSAPKVQSQDVIPVDLNTVDDLTSNLEDSDAKLPEIIEVVEIKGVDIPIEPKIEPQNGLQENIEQLEIDNEYEAPDDVNYDDVPIDVVEVADPVENSASDQIQTVDINNKGFQGIMELAPSELESLRVYFEDGMDELPNEEQIREAQMQRLGLDDPNLR